MNKIKYESIAKTIVHSCYNVHREMGPGLLESIYELCLIEELKEKKLNIKNQVSIPLIYKDTLLTKDFKIDILIFSITFNNN